MARFVQKLMALIAVAMLFSGLFATTAKAWGITSIRLESQSWNGCNPVFKVWGGVTVDPNTEWSWVDSNGNTWSEPKWVHMGAHEERPLTLQFDPRVNGQSAVVSFKAFGKDHVQLGQSDLTVQIVENPACAPQKPSPTPSPTPENPKVPTPVVPTPVAPTPEQPTPVQPTPVDQPPPVVVPPSGQPPHHSSWKWSETAGCTPNYGNDPNYSPYASSTYTFTLLASNNFNFEYLSDGGSNTTSRMELVLKFTQALHWENGLGFKISAIGYNDSGDWVQHSRTPAWIIPDPNTEEGAAWYKNQGCWYTPPEVKAPPAETITTCVQYQDGGFGSETYPKGGSPEKGKVVDDVNCQPAKLPVTAGQFDPMEHPEYLPQPWGGVKRLEFMLEYGMI